MRLPITRRAWLALAGVTPMFGQIRNETKPDLGPRLNALWSHAYGSTARNSAVAVIVSTVGYQSLPPLRGWRDERFLNAYIEWSDRPESAGIVDKKLTADLGPCDWILLRSEFGHAQTKIRYERDPIGFSLFKLPPGRHQIPIEFPQLVGEGSYPLPVHGLNTGPLPTIDTIIAAGSDIVTLYGTGFEGDKFEIASETGAGAILYKSLTQINARVPSLDRVRLIIDGSATPWVAVKQSLPVKKR